MPLFSIIGHDVADSTAQRKKTRPEHLLRLQQLESESRLVIAGPNPKSHDNLDEGMLGSLMIVEFDNLKEAESWCNDEPYLRDGVYSHVDIKPFLKVMPAE